MEDKRTKNKNDCTMYIIELIIRHRFICGIGQIPKETPIHYLKSSTYNNCFENFAPNILRA